MPGSKRIGGTKRTNMRFKLVTQAGIRRIKEIYRLKTDTEAVDLAVYFPCAGYKTFAFRRIASA